MKFNKLIKLIIAALFTAIVCVATYIVQIPMPATGGFVNLGDCFVLTAGFVLGPVYGGIAAGLGSMLTDILAGYPQYAPATFIIKALMAVVFYYITKASRDKLDFIFRIIGGIVSEAIMVLCYFGYEAVILKYGMGAAGSILGNVGQGVVGLIAAAVLCTAVQSAIKRSKTLSEILK